jgi:hypothetical protein
VSTAHFYIADGPHLVRHFGFDVLHASGMPYSRMPLDLNKAFYHAWLKLDIAWRHSEQMVVA